MDKIQIEMDRELAERLAEILEKEHGDEIVHAGGCAQCEYFMALQAALER